MLQAKYQPVIYMHELVYSSVLFSNIGLYEHLLQWAFYAEERRKSREDVDVFISLLLSTGGTLAARQDVSRVGARKQ